MTLASLPLNFAGKADAEDLADLMRGQTPEPEFAATFEDPMDVEMAFEDELRQYSI